MSKFRHGNAARDAHIRTLRLIIGALLLVAGGLWYGWQNAPEQLTVHIPPTLRSGSTRVWWKVPPADVYAFAFYVWQQINRWPDNGRTDYKANIAKYKAYLTPGCRRFLKHDYQARKNRNELQNRVRGVYEIAGQGYQADDVKVLNRDHWVVQLDLNITQYLNGMSVRNTDIRYYLRVIRHDVDASKNPWGLQLDCFARPPKQLDTATAAKQDNDSGAGGAT
ncbi:PFL_4703 family integrating conjugative element protein [Salinisphaera orenii]|uniref:PFL_4703 family integrating conjugative element protein n=1 Tax=Salinisphaera orenii TaxID=856731 RepID=UPI000DBE660A